MNFADKQRKNYWDSVNKRNSNGIHHKSHTNNNSNSEKPEKAKSKEKTEYKKSDYSVQNKAISDDSYKPELLFADKKYKFYHENKSSASKDEFEKGIDELKKINFLIEKISNSEFYAEEKYYIEDEFNNIQDKVKNIEVPHILKRNNLLKDVYNNYLTDYYNIKIKDYKNELNHVYADISKLSFLNFDIKHSKFFIELCNKSTFKEIEMFIEKDYDFSDTLEYILDFYIKNKSKDLVKRYNILIKRIKKLEYKNQKTIDEINKEYEIIMPQLINLNKLINYFNNRDKIKIKKFDVTALIEKNNNKLIREEYNKNKEFFNNFMGKKLDEEQIKIVISDEDNTKIIAGAGSGKTFTLQAKLKYLLDYKGVNQDKILCLSFSRAAVNDLKRKIKETIGENNVNIHTYHSFGGKILKNNRKKYIPNNHLLYRTIDNYFKDYVLSDENKMQKIVDFFNLHNYMVNIDKRNLKLVKSGEFYEMQDTDNFHETLKDKVQESISYLDILDGDKYSINRDHVRSYEELMIANFLYINNIDYIYETDYFEEDDFDDEENFIQYRPDFYLPKDKIYIEHFGVDKKFNANWLRKESERKKYKQSIFWKRNIHKKHKTKLIETYSHYNKNGVLLEKLEDKLRKNGVVFGEIDYGRIYEKLIENKKLDNLDDVKDVIKRFISLFKDMSLNIDENGNDCSNLSFQKIYDEIDSVHDNSIKTRDKFLLDIIKDIYDIYNSKKEIDYADMINKPIKLLKNDSKLDDFDYIFVDEYQDTSFNKYRFLKELKKRTDAKLIVIGDDWQSIYGFNGCRIELFTKFEDYFDHTKIFKIQNTYRNSNDLVNLSSKFIKKNDSQIPKELTSDKDFPHNPIKLTKVSGSYKTALIFESIIDEIIREYPNGDILILGRYNKDFKQILVPNLFICENLNNYNNVLKNNGFLTIKYLKNENVNIKFRTMHKAKGLQEDNVVIIGLKDAKKYGFPSQHGDDSLITYILKRQIEGKKYPEERRLFYVALTRTKNNVYLIADKKNPSSFVEELWGLDERNSIEFKKYGFNRNEIVRMKKLLNRNSSFKKSKY